MKLSSTVEQLIQDHETISLAELIKLAGNANFGFLLLLIALPSALPVPAPGFSAPFGFMIVILAGQMLGGRNAPWFPAGLTGKTFSLSRYRTGLPKLMRFIRFFERFVHPRLAFVFWAQNRFLALIVLGCGLSMMIPIPGTNTLPALAVFIMGLGLIEKDGFLSLLGASLGVLGVMATTLLLIFGPQILLAGLRMV